MRKLLLLLFAVLLTSLSGSAFDFKEGNIYYDITGSNTVKVTYVHYGSSGYDYYGYSGDVNIPSSVTHNGTTYQVTAIGHHAFNNCPDLTSVSIPNTVTSIGYDAFLFCTGLSLMTIPNSVTDIESEAFYGCSGMRRVVIGSGVTYIGQYAFCDCYNLNFVGCLATTPPTMAASNVFDDDTYSYASVGVPKGRMSAYQAANWWKNFDKFEELPYDFIVGGIYYTITGSNTVEVATAATATYSGSVSIPRSVTYGGKTYNVTGIGFGAFAYCTRLTSVTIPSTVTYISDFAFMECPLITSLTIPSGVATIGERAFAHCTGLTWVNIGNTVTTIGYNAFWDCEALRTVLCDAITPPTMEGEFEDETYSNGTLKVPRGCKNAYKAADGWKQFTTIQETDFAFGLNNIFYNITSSNTVEVTHKDYNYNSYSGSVIIPSSVTYCGKTYNVTAIGTYAFANCSALTSVTIPATVTTISERAFSNCTVLAGITIPNSVIEIGNYAFYNCQGMSSVTIGNKVMSIGSYAFYSCTGLTSVFIPNSVSIIYSRAFYNCTNMTDLFIGNSVTSIGMYAFYNCPALTSVTCRNATPPTMASTNVFGSTTYSNATLYVPSDCLDAYKAAYGWKNFSTIYTRLYDFVVDGIYYRITGTNTVEVSHDYGTRYSGNVNIPSSVAFNGTTYQVTAIGDHAFSECDNLTGVSIPSSVTAILDYAFAWCSSLPSVNIPSSVNHLGTGAFYECSVLTSVNIPSAVTAIPDMLFLLCDGLTSIAIPSSVTSIGLGAFASCRSLTSVTIPNSVTHIGTQAFQRCSALTSVTLPASLTELEVWAFDGCTSLMSVTCLATTPPMPTQGILSNVFSVETMRDGILFVPKSSMSAYQGTEYWEAFTNIKPTLNYALNTSGGTIGFTSTGDYPWTNMIEGNRVYAVSGNKGVHSCNSTMTASVTLAGDGTVSFDFKAWGEGTIYDRCIFRVDGTQLFSYGARKNDWETYTAQLTAGTHTLTWTYSKDSSVNPEGDYFAIDNVVVTCNTVPGDVDGDGRITIGDVSDLIDMILSGNATVEDCPAADIDGDGRITIGDVSDLIDSILGS